MGIGVLVVLWWPVSTASFHDAQHGAHGQRMMVACKHCLGGVMDFGGTMVAMLFNENGGHALQRKWWPCSSTSRSSKFRKKNQNFEKCTLKMRSCESTPSLSFISHH
uniref:Uncharacterized protein n=1 Tax=Meloidogyne enterolobii TaxID=390850 RepID=A0A6V7V5C0_MELEN|nr:unnamed protein product [Meloidogyne enterolobii]